MAIGFAARFFFVFFNSFTGLSPMLTGLERQSPEIPHNFKHILGGAYENGKF